MKTRLGSAQKLVCLILFPLLLASHAAQAQQAVPFERGAKIEMVVSKPSDIKGGDYDDKVQKIVVKMKVTNVDTRQTYEGYTATVSVLAQSVLDRAVRRVVMQESVPLSLAPRQNLEHQCQPVVLRFDKTGSAFGYFYDGWVVVVKDDKGKVVQVRSTSPAIEKLPEKAAGIRLGGGYSSKLDPASVPDDFRSR